ncbi:spore coat protein CotJB [Desulfofalx alkaliphila]|uniref:spore coat protein CotJB n=1 Tax=Desulfofalx alkaliphila TaxID=105483 RepID=UPI0004E0D64D|nr:spore coat protein CotJB [Desulfofalx alkaliphila]
MACLDGRCMKLLYDLMEWGFAQTELILFLDTHPDDVRALEEYNRVTQRMNQLTREYEAYCGPLVVQDFACPQEYWAWLETPWPWEIDY